MQIEKRVLRTGALCAGAALLLMAVIAGTAYGNIHPKLFHTGEILSSGVLPVESRGLFVIELVLWSITFCLDIIVSVSLFYVYKSNKKLSFTVMMLRLVYTIILGISIILLSAALNSENNALRCNSSFERIWFSGLILFGVYLVVLGITAIKSSFTPKVLSVLLMIGGIGYILFHTCKFAGDKGASLLVLIEPFLTVLMAIPEIIFSLWLLYYALIKSKKK